jgi:hypothetical protein
MVWKGMYSISALTSLNTLACAVAWDECCQQIEAIKNLQALVDATSG